MFVFPGLNTYSVVDTITITIITLATIPCPKLSLSLSLPLYLQDLGFLASLPYKQEQEQLHNYMADCILLPSFLPSHHPSKSLVLSPIFTSLRLPRPHHSCTHLSILPIFPFLVYHEPTVQIHRLLVLFHLVSTIAFHQRILGPPNLLLVFASSRICY